ncbi:alpha/beta hydrolase [Dyella tabacisoli]|uniref:Alpha/beta hydrolase n=1 Tax=Dyella tabacisoli TaxID=2282381 RepID=A0A369UIA9_9GAMM|nr:alpha/beta hydrolase [Dyella tabacisoli]RDD80286.1 alpha/beta hydrolase [Dyella tabacisoli]
MFWRVMAVFAALVLLLYGAFCGYLYLSQRQLIYRPEGTWLVRQPPNLELRRDGVVLRGWVMNPGQSKALLYFGGNGERIEDAREELARWFPHYTVYLLAYRGYAASEGAPSEPALVADAQALYDQVAPHHAAIAVIGRSLGSGVAIQLAVRRPVGRLILVTPFDSMSRMAQSLYPWVPVSWLLNDRYESWRYAAEVRCPVLLLRAGDDMLVAPQRTARLAASFHTPPLQQVVEEAGHNTIQDYAEYQTGLSRFLQ